MLLLDRPASAGPSTAADKKRGAVERDAAKFAAEAAYRQRVGETLDWLGSARIALQVRTACTMSVFIGKGSASLAARCICCNHDMCLHV